MAADLHFRCFFARNYREADRVACTVANSCLIALPSVTLTSEDPGRRCPARRRGYAFPGSSLLFFIPSHSTRNPEGCRCGVQKVRIGVR
jgi:hypothetical protein